MSRAAPEVTVDREPLAASNVGSLSAGEDLQLR